MALLRKTPLTVPKNKYFRRWHHEYVLRDHLGRMRVRLCVGQETANPSATV